MLYPLFFAAVYLSHLTLLRLPYFWDEAGYYIPAAWDFFRTGSLIPQTTATNAHPPLPSILLAGWWHVSGFVPSGTRTLICMVTAAALLGVYGLARGLVGARAAVATTALTAIYPIWFAQSTLAHADIFAAAFTLWGLGFYFEAGAGGEGGRHVPGAKAHLGAEARMPGLKSRPISEAGVSAASTAVVGAEAGMPGLKSRPISEAGVFSEANFISEAGVFSEANFAAASWARGKIWAAVLFSLAALSKETAVITPAALALWEGIGLVRERRAGRVARERVGQAWQWIGALLAPVLPLAMWYAYHFHRTGFVFGNPEFLRYNATANLDAQRIALCLYHRLLHLTMHMNMFVPVSCAVAALFMPAIAGRARLAKPVLQAIAVVLVANWIAFSVLGGALLTRYLLPMYPLVLLVCVAQWQRHVRKWGWLAALSAAAFLCGIWINPPYAFAPEDNLTYRDFIVLHQRAVAFIAKNDPQATVLTAWPAVSELERPELGYTKAPIKAFAIKNFSFEEMEKAAADPGDYDTALLFSTKWAPASGGLSLIRRNAPGISDSDARYFDFHEDMQPKEAAELLHGEVVWQARTGGEWVAVLRFPRVVNASLMISNHHKEVRQRIPPL
jgi:4-amino-4-deoxy-L-arabinose transferase-like glycosyltransferase